MDEQSESETAMQRFEDLLGHLVSVTKEDVQKAERAAKKLADDLAGPPPSGAPALDEEDAE